MFVYIDKLNHIRAISERSIQIDGCAERWAEIETVDFNNVLGQTVTPEKKPQYEMRIAVICNWGQSCGISTYTRYLLDAIRPKVKELKIFSEEGSSEEGAEYCWLRGRNMSQAVKKVLDWEPDCVLIQHEFGLFPKATHFLNMLQMLQPIPYVVALHSVYEHLDKAVCTAAIENIIVHSEESKKALARTGNTSNVFVVPHGCVQFPDHSEHWNIFQTPYAIVQFGFGFFYKGVDVALEAIAYLKNCQPEKYKDIFYCYLCSENEKTRNIQNDYYQFLNDKIKDLGIEDNVAIIRKYQSEETLCHYLRTAKLALFPYVIDPKNTVYGASGAIRIAMANGTPTIASPSHLFDDLEGIIPRPSGHIELAHEIDKVFSDWKHRQNLVDRSLKFIAEHSWDNVADQYLEVISDVAF
jgi:glycosyltransferase involved in cell wall biosynthesis